ncbi:hypothetical protein GCM10028807_09350 [Spirosoma daeguense]
MLIDVVNTLFQRDLEKLKAEISLYKDEQKIWYVEKNIANSAGNLCLHLVGNLNTYIGGEFGKTGYVRHRDLEFSLKNIPRAELLTKIDETKAAVAKGLANVTEEQLNEEYPMLVFDKPTSTGYFLTHLTTHLTYHLGQINYHRRLLDT